MKKTVLDELYEGEYSCPSTYVKTEELPSKDVLRDYLFMLFKQESRLRKMPSTHFFMQFLLKYKWVTYGNTFGLVQDLKKEYLDKKAKGLI